MYHNIETGLRVSVSTSARGPIPACDEQDARFPRAFAILQQAILAQAFPGAAIAVTHRGKVVVLRGFGRFAFDRESPSVESRSIFDLASVSKALATTSMAMILHDRALLDLDAPLVSVVPEFAGEDPRRSRVILHHLLAHSSGLPAYEKLFLRARSPHELLAAAFAVPLVRE